MQVPIAMKNKDLQYSLNWDSDQHFLKDNQLFQAGVNIKTDQKTEKLLSGSGFLTVNSRLGIRPKPTKPEEMTAVKTKLIQYTDLET